MRPVTLWFRRLDKRSPELLNHVEDGHAPTDRPVGDALQNVLWRSSIWRRVHALRTETGEYVTVTGRPLQY